MDQWEREEQQLGEDLEAGLIGQQEYNRQLRELHHDYREAADEAASRAYEREMENWRPTDPARQDRTAQRQSMSVGVRLALV